jgi:hypothetical protein
MRITRLLCTLLLCALVFGFTTSKKGHWRSLYNGRDLTGWDTYIGPDLDDHGKPISDHPIGLNHDPRHVFTIVPDSDENLIRISGENWGAISTKKEYENYHLQLQFKWGQLTWGQKRGKKKDSGLLYHSVGKFGADYGAWMRSQEFQIEQTNCGDYWGVAGGRADIPVSRKPDTNYVYDPYGTMLEFSQESKQGRHCVKLGDAENLTGEWNTIDLYCHGDTSVHVVNGQVMMVLYRNRQFDNGHESPLTKGKIQIQSEGAEVYYRHIKIQSINQIPAQMLK